MPEEETTTKTNQLTKYSVLGAPPVVILAMIWNTMTDLTNNVRDVNVNLSIIAEQVQRNKNDIQNQQIRAAADSEKMSKIREDIAEIRAMIKKKIRVNFTDER